MWSKLIETFITTYLDKYSSKSKTGKALIKLHQSMILCQNSYLNYEQLRTTESYNSWLISFLEFHFEFLRLKNLLHIYDNMLYESILDYGHSEHITLNISSKSSLLLNGIEIELQRMNSLLLSSKLNKLVLFKQKSFLSTFNIYARKNLESFDPDFMTVKERLETFIKDNFTIDELDW